MEPLKGICAGIAIAAPVFIGLFAGSVGGDAYYKSNVDGLEPNQVHVTWQQGKEINGQRIVDTTSTDFKGLGTADVIGKPLGNKYLAEEHWVIPPGQALQALPKEIVFEKMPTVKFQGDRYANIRDLIFFGGGLAGFVGSVGTLSYLFRDIGKTPKPLLLADKRL